MAGGRQTEGGKVGRKRQVLWDGGRVRGKASRAGMAAARGDRRVGERTREGIVVFELPQYL